MRNEDQESGFISHLAELRKRLKPIKVIMKWNLPRFSLSIFPVNFGNQ